MVVGFGSTRNITRWSFPNTSNWKLKLPRLVGRTPEYVGQIAIVGVTPSAVSFAFLLTEDVLVLILVRSHRRNRVAPKIVIIIVVIAAESRTFSISGGREVKKGRGIRILLRWREETINVIAVVG